MLYQRRSFTLPATNTASQMKWDFTFMTAEEFMGKYAMTVEQYEDLKTKTF